ncbi:hypothetical protein Leryth_023047 [Lithospermum erythrorhizon]|nr:hypothetical protein Leryth_023047 [Lithospermum erythrorhizon]
MVLRGQGDSPVRICEPCKKLEEAARFEMRYGHKNKSGRGSSRVTSKNEEEVLNQILGTGGKVFSSSARSSSTDMLSLTHQTTNNGSCSNSAELDTGGRIVKSVSLDQQSSADTGDATPDELRQQAIEEKKKYKTLKAEGKSEDALKAFKRGKELERLAAAQELYLRKNRKKALTSTNDDSGAISSTSMISPQKNEGKDDIASELKELGWSDMDLRDAEKRPATLSLESELSTLLGDVSQKSSAAKITHGPDKSQVIAHKKKALELKRAGNLVEAKEELKKAKLLEKQIEEQEFLGESDDSDDELSLLMRSIDNVKDDGFSVELNPNYALDIDLLGASDNFNMDSNFEVTEDDMDDPEIAAALTSLGWTEGTQSVDMDSDLGFNDKEAMMDEVLNEKRVGNPVDAMSLMKKAKVHETDLNMSKSQTIGANADGNKYEGTKREVKSKILIQKELIALKKKAFALKREGKMDEAEEELNKGKILEERLQELDKPPKASQLKVQKPLVTNVTVTDPEDESDVTDQDMHDPAYLSLLQNLGWKDEDNHKLPPTAEEVERSEDMSCTESDIPVTSNISKRVSRKTKGQIQSELLGLKRKAFALRRQGQVEEAEEVLKNASLLEAQLAEIETPQQNEISAVLRSDIKVDENTGASLNFTNIPVDSFSDTRSREKLDLGDKTTPEIVKEKESRVEKSFDMAGSSTTATMSQNDRISLQQEILAHKRVALKLKREGKLAEAKEELAQAKLLEKNLGEKAQTSTASSDVPDSKVAFVEKKENNSNLGPIPLSGDSSSNMGHKPSSKENSPNIGQKPLSGRNRFKLQQESLSHKRQALKLRREGRTEEADAELELAKALESQLEESTGHDSTTSSAVDKIDDVIVESFLDPELLSALKAIGIQDGSSGSQGPQGQGHVSKESSVTKADSYAEDRVHLEEQIKAEKTKALQLKRSGKQAEAMDALRRSKLYEKKLNDLIS